MARPLRGVWRSFPAQSQGALNRKLESLVSERLAEFGVVLNRSISLASQCFGSLGSSKEIGNRAVVGKWEPAREGESAGGLLN